MHGIDIAAEQCMELSAGRFGRQDVAAFRRETPADSACRIFRQCNAADLTGGSLPYENRYLFSALLLGAEGMAAEDTPVHRDGANAVDRITSVGERDVESELYMFHVQGIRDFGEFRDGFQLPADRMVKSFAEDPVFEQCLDGDADFLAAAADLENRIRRGGK